LGRTRYLPDCWVEAAEGGDRVASVRLRCRGKTWIEPCDYLAVAYGLVPNTELAELLGCEIVNDAMRVNELQQTSVPNVYCAGESTGIGGLDLSLVEGEIAGYAASGRTQLACSLFSRRTSAARFATGLERAFELRDELRTPADATTVICRCEDVTLGQLRSADSWRSAKLHLRCGMGPCQGRVCGPIVQFLFGWKAESIRPPLFPARLASLISQSISLEKGA
jgi:D-hydroxyproline dehydrogenase subunit alpha